MTKEKADKIIAIYDWVRFIILVAFFLFLIIGTSNAQTTEERVTELEKVLQKGQEKSQYMPQLHGILRGKYEYEPDLDESRFEVRNARLSASGKLPFRSEYKLELDFWDETEIKTKDAWVRINPWKTLRISLGQQRMPFSIDAHRNPSAQYFANRSFIAKQVGDMRDVGLMVGYSLTPNPSPKGEGRRPTLEIDAGIFNGSNIKDEKEAWHSDMNYSARLQYWQPIDAGTLVIMPSVQHDAINNREAHYTSMDFGAYYEMKGLHVEAEYLRKYYQHKVFDDCSAVDAMALYKQNLKKDKGFLKAISYLARYDFMQDHTDGKSGFAKNDAGESTGRLILSDAERHRMTLGVTLHVNNPYFPTDIRFNYEKYWYPHGGAKESEQDKLVAELAIRF